MFRPSQALLLRFTPSLGKLHQPLPLNRRKSRELLELLTTSFRTHLDKEHGPTANESAVQKPTGQLPIHSRGNVVDQHMQSLFSNPLLKSPPAHQGDAPAPMDIFERAVANGMMDVNVAATCLYREKANIFASGAGNTNDKMRQSGAGLKVLRWLTSSGTADADPSWMHGRFCKILMRFLVAEGLQEAAWTLIKTTLDSGRPLGSQISVPIFYLIIAEANSADCLDMAYLRMEEAFSHLQGMPLEMKRKILRPALLFLINTTTNGIYTTSNSMYATRSGIPRMGQPTSEKRFESFLDLFSKHPETLSSFPFHLAHLHLAHPTRPSAKLALETLPLLSERVVEKKDQVTSSSSLQPIISLALDTTRFLLDNNRLIEADLVMQFLRRNFSKELGERQQERLDNEAAEASSLEMLNNISLA